MSAQITPRRPFTAREREILSHLTGGATYRAIARALSISPHTVDTHMRRLRTKTGARNRTQLVVMAFQLGYAPPRGIRIPEQRQKRSVNAWDAAGQAQGPRAS